MKNFRINNVHTNLGFFNLERFLKEESILLYERNGIFFSSMVFTRDAKSTGRIAVWDMKVLY